MQTPFDELSRRHLFATLAVSVLIAALGGACRCPEPQIPGPASDDRALLDETTKLLDGAKTSKTWSEKDQRAFNDKLPRLTFETRFRLAQQWTGLITSNQIVMARSVDKEPPPLKCICASAPCGGGGSGGPPR